MSKRLAVTICMTLLAFAAARAGAGIDNQVQAIGFVCRTVPGQSLAVVTPLSGAFPEGARIRFFDDSGTVCATGVVRSSYTDLAYVAVDDTQAECLKKGFVASVGAPDNEVRMLCGYSMNLPMVIEKGGQGGHTVPPNVILIRYNKDTPKPVAFRHASHEMECWKCHHRRLDAPCGWCHPVAAKKGHTADRCLHEICSACHGKLDGKPAECAWCHKDGPPRAAAPATP